MSRTKQAIQWLQAAPGRTQQQAAHLHGISQAAISAALCRTRRKPTEADRLQESADFWRNRANAFELALRQIVAVTGIDAMHQSEKRYDIANRALEDAKK